MKQLKQEIPDFQHPQSQTTAPAYGQVFSDTLSTTDIATQTAGLQQQIKDIISKNVNFNTDIIGLFETINTVPTAVPASPYEQVKLYVNGSVFRVYWYDSLGKIWHYAQQGPFAGVVAANGTAVSLPSGWTSAKTNTGRYTVTHNLGTTSYAVVISPTVNNADNHDVASKGSNSFTTELLLNGGFADCQFDFLLTPL